MLDVRTRISAGGRIVLPAEFRRALGLEAGDEVILRLEGDEVRLRTPEQAIRRAQDVVSRFISAKRSLAQELIAERRSEYTADD